MNSSNTGGSNFKMNSGKSYEESGQTSPECGSGQKCVNDNKNHYSSMHTHYAGVGPPNLPPSYGCYAFKDKGFSTMSPPPHPSFGGPPIQRQMLDAFMRNDMLALHNPYLFPRPYSFTDWMSMQQMYDNYMEFLNYIGESPTPQLHSHSPVVKTQSVQTQTPIHEFKSTMIQTDVADIYSLSLSETTDSSEVILKSSTSMVTNAVKKIHTSPLQKFPESHTSPLPKLLPESSEPDVCSTTEKASVTSLGNVGAASTDRIGALKSVHANDIKDPSECETYRENEDANGPKAAFLDNDDLIMPVPRSRGRGKQPSPTGDAPPEPIPGQQAKNTQRPNQFERQATPGPQGNHSTIPRSRGRGQPPHHLKLTIPTSSMSDQNISNNTSDSCDGMCESFEVVCGGDSSPNLKTRVSTPTTTQSAVSVPPGFEGKPVSPPIAFNLNIPISPVGLLSFGGNFNPSFVMPINDQNQQQPIIPPGVVDVGHTKKPKTPPGFSANQSPITGISEDQNLKPTEGPTEDHHNQDKNIVPPLSKSNALRDKMQLPVFSKMYKAKKTCIQNYLRASLKDNKKRKRMPQLALLEKIEERNEDDLQPDADSEKNLKPLIRAEEENTTCVKASSKDHIPDNTEKSEVNCMQSSTEFNFPPYAKTKGDLPRGNLHLGKMQNEVTHSTVKKDAQLSEVSPQGKHPRQCSNAAVERHVDAHPLRNKMSVKMSPNPGSPSAQSNTSKRNNRIPTLPPSNDPIPTSGEWEDVVQDVYVPCKFYNKQLRPIYEANGLNPSD